MHKARFETLVSLTSSFFTDDSVSSLYLEGPMQFVFTLFHKVHLSTDLGLYIFV